MIEQFEKLIDKLLRDPNKAEHHKPPSSKKQKILDAEKSLSSLDVFVGLYRLLKYDLKKYAQKWDLNQLVAYLDDKKLHETVLDYKIKQNQQDSLLVKWFILEILCMLLPILPSQKENIFKHYFTSDQIEDLQQRFQLIIIDDDLNYLNEKINEQPNEKSNDQVKTNFNVNDLELYKRKSSFSAKDLAVKITNQTKNLNLKEISSRNTDLVLVNTTTKNIERLELAMKSGNCIIVEGALSSGKTSLIHYLSEKYNVKLIKYQIDDNMDDKALIGNYVCSHIPGEFVWKPGPLYQAVYEDCWLVLEDFDHSPIDSLSLLIDLLETKCLKTSSNVSLDIKPNFRLFLTSRTGLLNFSNSNFIDSIKKLSRKVDLKELDQTEIIEIICQKFPKFKTNTKNKIVENVLETLKVFSTAECLKLKKIGQRTLSLRDLFKLFERLNSLENAQDRRTNLLILNDIHDVFLASIQDKFIRSDLCTHLATRFNINKDEALNLIINNKPNFEKKLDEIICGRVKLSIKKINTNLNTKSSLICDSMNSDKFVYTKSALKLLEQIARCIECNEPVLLSGETGVGKTSSLQHLAKLMGKKINVINLSQQTETSDLLGNFKPVDIKSQMKFLKENFLQLFSECFNINENKAFLTHVNNTYSNNDWKTLMQLLLHATNLAYKKFLKQNKLIWSKWKELEKCLTNYNDNLDQLINRFSFQFFEGVLTKAILNGEWIILDEINLASPETLQFLNPLLENNNSEDSSIILYEKGSTDSLVRHSDFRLFGAMNPASDIGKRNLPDSIRNRFTEIFVNELDSEEDLIILIREYLHSLTNVSMDLTKSIVEFYMSLKSEAFLKKLSNGTGAKPTYSLRTLCRALKYASLNMCNNSLLSVYDGLCLSFLTDLNRESSIFLEEHIRDILFKSKSKVLSKINRKMPKSENLHLDYINIEDYWIIKGLNEPKQAENSYIFTKSIKENLKRLVRVCSAQLPCLIQGDTSIGKTSLIKWLANATGNVLIRINNHDHTDLQEYVGSYVIEANGNLAFKEGLLATAMRNGYWILLDELNLASSEVLEALNRVLDDNRELYIPETQELIKAHPRFILFATQNPPGKYAGRKQLSRAFRNRFIELHFEEVPEEELLEIVEKKCQLPNSYARLLIRTVVELKTKRSQMGGIFLGKHSLITLRDLFRWAKRYSTAIKMNEECSDWKQYLAEQGLLILASRCRSLQDVQTIHSSIQSVFNKKIDLANLDAPLTFTKPIMDELNKIIEKSKEIINESLELKNFVWTPSARRTALFVSQAYKFNEPFLLVGETGIGKTTICQILSRLNKKNLHIMNCHMHSEASDFLGSIRPIRTGDSSSNQLFEWQDGPLIDALRQGQDFLIDEISLADDSVLERLNSVLEDERSLLLAENTNSDRALIKAHVQFRIFATMNPGGDFGKKELSAALRNRFTEIWCPTPTQESDEFEIICNQKLVCSNATLKNVCVKSIINFLRWLKCQEFFNKKTLTGGTISIRDLIKWINFINKFTQKNQEETNYFIGILNGACLVFIDALNNDDLFVMNPYNKCITYLIETIQNLAQNELNKQINLEELFGKELQVFLNEQTYVKCGPFEITKGDEPEATKLKYSLDSKSTRENLLRILRSLLMDSPIMLEGSPGVGKTSIIEAIGALTRNKVIRINLSEQTDLSELFGADLPVANQNENSQQAQQFNWIDGPFLLALKKGYWIILDEINLASQSVLEGLNSCFDHRGEIYISELNKKFQINKSQTKIFACQNPYLQGGGRKGLPKSFLNRFSKVYINKMTQDDLFEILSTVFNANSLISKEIMHKMILFNSRLHQEVNVQHLWGTSGSPWEFNLRDLFRWCEIMSKENNYNPGDYVYLIYACRFRFEKDRNKVYELFRDTFACEAYKQEEALNVRFSRTHLQIGQSFLRYESNQLEQFVDKSYSFTNSNLKHLEAVLKCLEMNWMVILVGHTCVGKTSLIRMLAKLINQPVIEFSVNSSTDTSDLLGGFAKSECFKNEISHLISQLDYVFIQIMNAQFSSISQRLVQHELLISSYLAFNQQMKKLFNENFIQNEISIDFIMKFFETNLHNLTKMIESSSKLTYLSSNLTEISTKLKLLIQKEINNKKSKKKISFEWIDSALVRAIERGDWVLIDNSNFCSPSVLDRLNPLLEPNGCIQINEKGLLNGELTTLRPHKNFRLILCMNEYFGELSRPMRNRGIEIYLNEFDQTNQDDERAILKNLYTLDHKDFEFYYKQISLISLEEMKRINFADMLKIFRMIHDYCLLNENREANLKYALDEFRLNFNEITFESNPNVLVHFFSDISKLKEIPLYRFVFNFPLFSYLISNVTKSLSKSTSFKLKNLEETFVNSIKLTQFIEIWLKNITLNSMSNVFKFTYSYLISNSNSTKRLKKSLELLQNLVVESIFNTSTNSHFKEYLNTIEYISQQTGLDLTEENLDLASNRFLLVKLTHNNLAKETLDKVINLGNVIKMQIFLSLFRFRMHTLYTIEHDSLLSMVKNLENINLDANNNIISFKFILMFYDLCDFFIRDVLNALSLNLINYDITLSQIKSNVYHLEKFFLLATCSFDSHLTLSYMKFQWNLIQESFVRLDLNNNIWSKNFESLHGLFNKCLLFDDTVFQQYRSIWLQNRPNIYIMNTDSLQVCQKLNETLIRQFKFCDQSNREFIEKIFHLKLMHNLDEKKQLLFDAGRFSDESISQLCMIECCQMEKFYEEMSKMYTKASVCQYLNSIFYANQTLAFESFVEMFKDIKLALVDKKPIRSITNLSDLFTRECQLGKFNFLFQQAPSSLVVFFMKFESLIQNYTNDSTNEDISENHSNFLSNYLPNEKSQESIEFKSAIHYDWISEFLTKFYFNSPNQDKKQAILNDRLKIELAYYDLKLAQIKQFVKLAWENHSLISNVYTSIDTPLLDMLNSQMSLIREKCFESKSNLVQEYLVKKNYDEHLFSSLNETNSLVRILKLGSQMAYLFAPVEPLDPFEYEQLIEKSAQSELVLSLNETSLRNFNKESKLRSNKFIEIDNAKHETQKDFYLVRNNKSDYFYLMNEINNGLSMFCSKHLVSLVKKMQSNQSNKETIELECMSFISSLEKFVQKISSQFYSFADIVYLPLNAFSIVGYALKGLFTDWKKQNSLNEHNSLVSLVILLNQYPLKETHNDLADKLFEYANYFKQIDIKLSDELCLLSLMHLVNSSRYLTDSNVIPDVFYQLCVYFNQRYQAYKLYQENKNKVEEFKYKTYGQKETSADLEEKELTEQFPSFTQYFDEFVRTALDDKKKEVKENEIAEELQKNTEKLIDLNILSKSNDYIEIFAQDRQNINSEFYDKNLLQTFYKSYSLGFKIQMSNELTLDQVYMKDSLTSHIMYSSSLNFDFNYDISTNGQILSIYDFYNQSNRAQVLKCKSALNEFSTRLAYLLNQWDNNPILIELIRIIQRIELFDLNDPLVKYLTGLELLVERAQRWQLIESKMTSIEKELKSISCFIVEWRKYELNFWLQSLDLELVNCRKKCAYKWFHHVFSICVEILNEQGDQNEFLQTLKQFIHLSLNGDYLVRLKQLKVCYNIFKSNTSEASKFLSDALWNIYDFYNVLYTNTLNENLNGEKQTIEKELKDFIEICRWQDMNYWALKQATQKYNKGLFKIIKKFRTYLNQRIDFDTKQKQLEKELNSAQLSTTNFFLSKNTDDFSLTKNDETYHKKMVNLCKKVLRKKCTKKNFNYNLLEYSNELKESFKELNDSSINIVQEHDKNKDASKYKKDIKYLTNQKLKFISDLLKKLTHYGLSYRRGNLKLAEMHQNLSNLLYFEPILVKRNEFNDSNLAYYVCLNKYLEFKTLLDQNMQIKDAHLIPVEKFRGFVEHFFHLALEQKKNLNESMNKLFKFEQLVEGVTQIKDCFKFNEFNESNWTKMKSYARKSLETSRQISLFLSSVNSLESSESSELVVSHFIKNEFTKLNEQLSEIKQLDSNWNLKFPNELAYKRIENLNSLFDSNGGFDMNMKELLRISSQNYTPFENVFDQILNELKSLSSNLDLSSESISPNLDCLSSECERLKLKLLKSVESYFKKYSPSDSLVKFEAEFSLTNELGKNFEEDIKLLNLDELNNLAQSILTLIDQSSLISDEVLNSIKQIFTRISLYLNTYAKFVSHFVSYLNDNHYKTCKTLYVLISIFYDLKQNGLALPEDLNENENSEEQDDKNTNKFKTDDDDPKGLSNDAKGDKDVSDQIETEDQLDDAKREEDREKEKENEEESEPLEEEKNGIEMSDDFESKLENMEDKEEDNQNDQDENEEDDELDDQKGEVDQAEDRLDEKLWDDNEALSETEFDEQQIDEEELQDNKDNTSEEVGAKQDELAGQEDQLEDNEDTKEDTNKEEDEKEENLVDEEMKSIKDETDAEEEKSENEEESNENEMNDKETEKEEKEEKEGEDEDENINDSKDNLETLAEQSHQSLASQNLHGQNENENDLKSNSQVINKEQNKQENENKLNEDANEIEMNQNENLSSSKDSNPIDSRTNLSCEMRDQTETRKKKINENRQLADDAEKESEKSNKNVQDLEEQPSQKDEENKESIDDKQDLRHIKPDEEHFDDKVFDAATENQKLKKNKRNEEEMNEKIEEESKQENRSKKLRNENEVKIEQLDKVKSEKNEQNLMHQDKENDQIEQDEAEIKTEQTLEEEEDAKSSSTYVTSFDKMLMYRTREQVEKNLEKYRQLIGASEMVDSIDKESTALWQDYELLTQQMSKELCEQLKLILEPKICTKLKGDYKSGKRLNMKRVVEYLATEYRKDKIWLRRVKPFKRNYQVMLAIDNSSSMSDNHCIQLAYETIATLANAFNYLEVGQLGLLKFGDKVESLHELQTNFSSDDGARIISQINFKDERTKIAEMLNLSVELFMKSESNIHRASSSSSSVNVSKLLFVLSDGRGIFYEGLETVKNALKDSIQEGIFIVFILLETQSTKSSIFDIKMPIFTPGSQIPTIKSYMEQFPFPFYVVLKDINNLSAIISEALKEWFDMLSRIDS